MPLLDAILLRCSAAKLRDVLTGERTHNRLVEQISIQASNDSQRIGTTSKVKAWLFISLDFVSRWRTGDDALS